ncbi:hypothetical protein HYN48_01035 [Flavobacterium magnum]|uniref:Fibronectin type-III domain-containing protein n=1 Tax=Flavobacterium magnum TaxID=2162713 RepID=A0A2S0RB55_9FLAO|nr:fibronectin type III domain-containing protein [Flavobacterium magnum]AWA28784.1 hypothetical protein HYN48_01035 [Flavobacterium magnum]
MKKQLLRSFLGFLFLLSFSAFAQPGMTCADPIVINSLPFQESNSTANFSDAFDTAQGASCGAIPVTTNYSTGNEVFYSYTSAITGVANITMTPSASASSIFIYEGCSNVGVSCVAGMANPGSSVRNLTLNITAGTTYIIVISSGLATQTVSYNLLIQSGLCTPQPVGLSVSNVSTGGASLNWGAASFSSWEVEVQPYGSPIPSGNGTAVASNSYAAAGLQPDTQYQFWVRAKCGVSPTAFTQWSGPYAFNTLLCENADKCNYIFRMSSTAGGWGTTRMQVRQNGHVVTTIGSTATSNSQVSVNVALCKDMPFELFWSTAGTSPQGAAVSILNPFAQTIYSKPAGTGAANTVLYSGMVNCTAADCSIPPTNPVVSNITLTTATFTWQPNYPGSTQFEMLLVPGPNAPNPLPDNATPASYPVITTTGPYTFTASNLQPATIYYGFIRALCPDGAASDWRPFNAFNTVICNDSDKCNYKFYLTHTSGTSWNGSRMQVRQNGIVVATLGATDADINNTAGVTVPLCTGVPFDLYWSTQGSSPSKVGVSIRNPFQDQIYEKIAGNGFPTSVLYSGVADCSQPACPKPFNVLVSEITTTSAKLSWLETGTATQWEIYAAPEGAPAPVNGSPVSTTGFHYVTSVKPFVIPNLNPQTNYKVYIRSLCSGNQPGKWTSFSPVSFRTLLMNDECASAMLLPVHPVGEEVFVAGSTLQATASSPQPAASCEGADDDVWFRFVAESTKQLLTFTAPAGSDTLNYLIYAGNCTTPILGCSIGRYTRILDQLTPGSTYIIRVFTYSTSDADSTDFKISVSTPAPLTNTQCSNALPVPVNPSMGISEFVSGTTLGSVNTNPASLSCGTTVDDVWFSFVAEKSIHLIQVNSTGGSVSQLLYAVYGAGCAGAPLYCTDQAQSMASGLLPGNTYYVRVFTGYERTAYGNFDISVTTPPDASNDEATEAVPIVTNPGLTCENIFYGSSIGATASPQPVCDMQPGQGDVWYVFAATSESLQLDIRQLVSQSSSAVFPGYALYTGTPENLAFVTCQTPDDVYSGYVVGQQYYLRVWVNWTSLESKVFSLCIKKTLSCENAGVFCGSTSGDPYLFHNVSEIGSLGAIACLGSSPNQVFYKLRIGQSGQVSIKIEQNTAFDAESHPVGSGLDVDFVAWGPFSNPDSCDQIAYTECTACIDNTVDQAFYPYGNIVDCSYSASSVEVLHLPNALSGEYYVVMITNFNGSEGDIKLTQTNYGMQGAGTTICSDKIRLIAFIDENNNGVKDIDEVNFPEGNFVYRKNDDGPFFNITTTGGVYDMYDLSSSDSYDFSFQVLAEYSGNYSASAVVYNNVSLTDGSQIYYFPVTVIQDFDDVSVSVVPSSSPVSGAGYSNKVVYVNEGTHTVSGTVTFQKDPALAISDISEAGVISNPNGFTYDFVNLAPFETRVITVNMDVPPIPDLNLGDLLTNNATIAVSGNDIIPANNTDALTQPVVGSYDPNDKAESHSGLVNINDLNQGDYLFYTIRFQNTGTFNASNIRLTDALDAMLDESSIRMVAASHIYTLQRTGSQLVWTFSNINLPGEFQDEARSHGYVTFKIKPKPGYGVGDIISNTAEIYFDTNPGVVTNTVQTEVSAPLGTGTFDPANILIYPNPANAVVYINLQHTMENMERVTLYDVLGKTVKQLKAAAAREIALDVADLAKGIYILEVSITNDLKVIRKLVIK